MKLLGLGDNTVDTYVDQGLQFPGGNAVNVAVLAKRLGADAAYLGCLGADEAGDLLFRALTREGVDLSRLRRRPGANARAMIGHRGGDRYFMGSQPGVRGDYRWTTDDFDYVAGFDLVHTSIYSDLGEALPRLGKAARRLSFDFSERWSEEVFARTLPHLDIAFLSHPKADAAACEALLKSCALRGPRIVVATRGEKGAMAFADGAVVSQGVVPVDIVDTLGAGDGFIAAFLVAHLHGEPLKASLAAGAAMAAKTCSERGAFGHGAPWRQPVDAALSQT